MKTKTIILAITGIMLLYSTPQGICQELSSQEKHLEVVKNHKARRIIHKDSKVIVYCNRAGNLYSVQGRLRGMSDSTIIIETNNPADYDPVFGQNLCFIPIDSIKIIGTKNLVAVPILIGVGAGLALMTAGLYYLTTTAVLAEDVFSYFFLGAITGAGSIATLTTGTLIYSFKWKKYNTKKGWEITVVQPMN